MGGPEFETQIETRLLIAPDVELFAWLDETAQRVRSILDEARPTFEQELLLSFRGLRARIQADPEGLQLLSLADAPVD